MNDVRIILLYGGGLVLTVSFGLFPYWILAFFPVIGQVYLIWLIWQTTATLINFYTIVTFIFGGLLV